MYKSRAVVLRIANPQDRPQGKCTFSFTMKAMIMRFLILLFLLSSVVVVSAQQDAQYTNFMNNKLSLNPAMAGSKGAPVLFGLVRQQWFGLEGAPASQAVGFHTPISNKNAGMGFVINNDVIGFTRSTQVSGNYAYHIQMNDKTYLSAGLSASARQYRIDWDEARATDTGDGSVNDVAQSSRIMANFGAGLLLYSDKFYVGVSAPRLMRNRISFVDDISGTEFASREDVHLYAMAGVLFPLSEQLSLKPAALVKYVPDAPVDLDIHASLVWRNLLSLGATYRLGGSQTQAIGESIDVLLSVQANENLRVGFAYDFTLSKIRQVSSGSAELFVEYTLGVRKGRLTNPRFF